MPGTMVDHSPRHEDLTPDEHLAEEWRLFQAIEAGAAGILYRAWEVTQPVVVVGRSTPVVEHVRQEACQQDGVQVLRRFTGGGAVVLGPGCLNYAVGLSFVSRPDLTDVAGSFETILRHLTAVLAVPGLSVGGGTDLNLNDRKISGNAQRRGRRALFQHGTLLYGFDATLASRYLKEPARQPAYRAGRCHTDFIGNLPLSGATIRSCLDAAWRTFGIEIAGPAA